MNQTLKELLSSYSSLAQGQEMDMESDPIYGTLFAGRSSGPTANEVAQTAGQQSYGSLQEMVRAMAKRKYGWGSGQWDDLQQLVQNESGWNPKADNPTSTAYGLFQFLKDTWASGYGGVNQQTNNPRKQARAGLDYIAARYGDPDAALDFWNRNHWY